MSIFKTDDMLASRNLARKSQPSCLDSPTIVNVKHSKKLPKEEPVKFDKAKFGKSSFTIAQDSKHYTIINELSKSDYFGEISILTKLPATATIHVVANTICCSLERDKFMEFMSTFSD